ncbi:uncharacterized protein LOC126897873 isoform X1 [Daktulosphaira vitifoliae]|uniref:uncharacterized protein LOC126897873 isoform X1 n=1 Tax=Daktulosphaira vitifoliae TaxID=58002 RepID=UPI0021AAFC77|nr:uncharacterized protein LOC126897873 isoform X1 [Daktulosphaira vitifoliae]
MIIISILTILLFNFLLVKSENKQRHCNFSRYMLNYFKHNEQYLLYLDKNSEKVTEEDLNEYDKAVQSHGNIVIFMIQELYYYHNDYYPSDLMTVNMYLNNISGSIIVIYKEDAVNDIKNNKVFLSLEGLKLLNHTMIKCLDNYIKSNCTEEPIMLFVEYPIKLLPSHILNIDQLSRATEYLREKLMTEINFEKINNQDQQLFHPKNILFYNLMTNDSEENLTIGTKSKRRQNLDYDKPKEVLDLLRFAPLNIKCADETHLTLLDFFRFAEYQFFFCDIKTFHKILRGAIFYPVGVLIADYTHFVNAFRNCKVLKKDNKIVQDSLVTLGKKIALILQTFINLKIYDVERFDFFKIISSRLHLILNWVKGIPLRNEDLPEMMLKEIKNFMLKHKLKFNLEYENIFSEKIFVNILNIILGKTNLVESYIQEIKNHVNSLYSVYNLKLFGRISVKNYKHFLMPDIIDNICKENLFVEDRNTSDNFNDLNNSSELNINDIGNNDGLDEFKITNYENIKHPIFIRKKNKSLIVSIEMKDFPKHMVDYFICTK